MGEHLVNTALRANPAGEVIMFEGKSVLVTGGTGSFGKKFTEVVLRDHDPERCLIFSRDELKQSEMRKMPQFRDDPRLRFFIGDVRDGDRLKRALDGVDYVVHAAALKQVPACEYNPFEAIKTNVLGAQNIIEAAIDAEVDRVIALSTDKACNPTNLYGATKLCSDKLFVSGNAYVGKRSTCFSVVRYGNVIGSRGSVVPYFLRHRDRGRLPITHPEMTRFWITLEQGVQFVLNAFRLMRGGEVFVPKIPSMSIVDLARSIAPECELDVVGIRSGEKLHEVMISEHDARTTMEVGDFYLIAPEFSWWDRHGEWARREGEEVPAGFRYSSDTNDRWLSPDELRAIVAPIENPFQSEDPR